MAAVYNIYELNLGNRYRVITFRLYWEEKTKDKIGQKIQVWKF